ncbi:MAG: hypothetical protein H6853_08750 [Rhodospirillales bacterium]|nr:hypothetical protein [Alphaproteobacteria bacterium]USO03594.1 MAG: hypothetical protein H6853_08750 [Rhodospirillales bacterium]
MSADVAAQQAGLVDIGNAVPANDPVQRAKLTSKGSLVEQFEEVASFLRENAEAPRKNLNTCGMEYGVDGVYLVDHPNGNLFLETRTETGAPESFLVLYRHGERKWIENNRPNKKDSIYSVIQKMRFMLGS